MAYLKGRSYVDGDLIVEGTLQVKKFTFSDDNILFYPADGVDSLKKNYLVRFASEDGALDFAPILVSNTLTSARIDIKSSEFTLSDYTENTLINSENILTVTHTSAVPSATFGSSVFSLEKTTVYDRGLKLIKDPSGEDYWVPDV